MNRTSTIEGYEIPLHLSLTQPILMGGVPRMFAILNGTVTAVLVLGLGVWWLGLPLGITLHAIACTITKKDPLWFDVFRRHLRHKSYLES